MRVGPWAVEEDQMLEEKVKLWRDCGRGPGLWIQLEKEIGALCYKISLCFNCTLLCYFIYMQKYFLVASFRAFHVLSVTAVDSG